MSILPSAPVSLLQRKIAKKLGRDPHETSLYTVRRIQSTTEPQGGDQDVWSNEKVARVEDGEVGYWFEDGDGIMIES